LKTQNLIIRRSLRGDWTPLPEELIDREARTSRAADVLLHRVSPIDGIREYALWDVRDWINDAGAAVRDCARRVAALERFAIARMGGNEPLPRTSCVFVVRATSRNRRLIGDHRHFFRARFPGSARLWLEALEHNDVLIPGQMALVWVTFDGERLLASRLA
jgi:hypothetical protein